MRNDLLDYDKEVLVEMLEDAAKLWLAHDGLWFLAIEERFDMKTAIELDAKAWGRFSPLEAQRIMARHGLPENGGAESLMMALNHRLYSHINQQTVERVDERTVILRMNTCRVQAARERKGLDLFPCKDVGLVEYSTFASAIDPRFTTRCLVCPPDSKPADCYCAWKFILREHPET